MHPAAYDYVGRFADDSDTIIVIELGSRDVNYTIRPHFPNATYIGVDGQEGPCVDVVANAATWLPTPLQQIDLQAGSVKFFSDQAAADIVICAELFEHTPEWPLIVRNAYRLLSDGGRAVFTMAGPGRPEHGVNQDDPFFPGWYKNISGDELALAMMVAGFEDIEIDILADDTRGTGVRP